jgi:hypothetical protein
VNVARLLQEPERVGFWPVAICNEAIATTKDVFVAAATGCVKEARRVIDALRGAAEDDSEVYGDPLASGWDDVVRRPHADAAISPFGSRPFEEGHSRQASLA